jgi:hypothetical protein
LLCVSALAATILAALLEAGLSKTLAAIFAILGAVPFLIAKFSNLKNLACAIAKDTNIAKAKMEQCFTLATALMARAAAEHLAPSQHPSTASKSQ